VAMPASCPSIVSVPVHAPGISRGTRPASASANVLLPEPDGPMTSRQAPAGTSRSMPWSAGAGAPA
jgi:hypothetical protein